MILDTLRDISNLLVRFDPLMRQTFYRTEQIYTKTTQTAAVIPRKSQPKVKCLLEIGIGSLLERDTKFGQKEYGELKVLYVGQFLAWKGMHLGLLAFARALCSIASARLTMVGKGPDERHWRQIADAAGISSFVTWRPWLSHDHLTEIYAEHDVLLFPSLHDSSGNVVLEAMAHGLPIICLDLGGPAVLVDNTCGRVISTGSASKEQVVRRLAHALIEVGNDRSQLEHLSAGAVAAARKFAWSDVVARVYPSSRNP